MRRPRRPARRSVCLVAGKSEDLTESEQVTGVASSTTTAENEHSNILDVDEFVEIAAVEEEIEAVEDSDELNADDDDDPLLLGESDILDDHLLANIATHVDDELLQEFFEEDEPLLSKNPISLEDLMSLTTKDSNIAYFYLRNEVGIPEDDMWKITHEAGSILGMTANNLRRKVHLMTRLMDLADDDVRTMLMRHPAVLHLSAKQNVAPTILFLQRSLDLSREDLRAMIVPFPSILGYSLANLKSKFNFYLKVCQFSKEEARKLFVGEPKLLTAGVKSGLIPRMHFFVSDLKLPLNELRDIVKKNPRVLLCSLEKNLRPKLQFYLIMTLGMDLPTVHTLLRKYPQFLNYNLEKQDPGQIPPTRDVVTVQNKARRGLFALRIGHGCVPNQTRLIPSTSSYQSEYRIDLETSHCILSYRVPADRPRATPDHFWYANPGALFGGNESATQD